MEHIERNLDGTFKRIYKVDENYFDHIDSEEKAYILGFFYADGCNSIDENSYSHEISFTQLEQDIDILEKIKKSMKSEHPLYKIIQKSNGKVKYKLSIKSRKLSDSLYNLGGINNKSLTLKFPDESLFANKSLIRHFIRGYFDGDGCVWNGKRKKMTVKDSSKPEGFRERIVHNVKFTFTGNYDFINMLQDYLVKCLGFKKTKLNFSKAKNPNNNTSENVCSMEYSGRKQMKTFYDFIYTNATIYGNRKFNKFNEIFCASEEKSSEDTSLIAETPEMEISSQASIVEEGSSTIPEMGVESSDSKCEAPNDKVKGEDIVSSAMK